LIRSISVSPESFDARFERILQEFAADRAEQQRHWDDQERKWEEQARKWEEDKQRWEENSQRWDEQNRTNQAILAEIKRLDSRYNQGIGALGARWGLASEHSFRAALRTILEQSFGVQVFNINEFDDDGMVFGVPDQVEIDVIIRNGEVILCELKSSMSRSDLYTFERKARYYERRHGRPVSRRIVVSPMLQPGVATLAERLGIETCTYAEDVTGLADN